MYSVDVVCDCGYLGNDIVRKGGYVNRRIIICAVVVYLKNVTRHTDIPQSLVQKLAWYEPPYGQLVSAGAHDEG